MTTVAVDTNVLFSVLYDDGHADEAEAALRAGYRRGRLVITGIVYAELSAADIFDEQEEFSRFLADTSVSVVDPSTAARFRAGEAFDAYTERRPDGLQCPTCGAEQTVGCVDCGNSLSPRQHVAADFVIGGHAAVDADELLTLDRGFYRSYFTDISVRPE